MTRRRRWRSNSSARKILLRTIGSGRFDQPVLSPDGRWLAVGSPDADQFVFLGVGRRQIRAVSNVSSQFRSRSFPDDQRLVLRALTVQ